MERYFHAEILEQKRQKERQQRNQNLNNLKNPQFFVGFLYIYMYGYRKNLN